MKIEDRTNPPNTKLKYSELEIGEVYRVGGDLILKTDHGHVYLSTGNYYSSAGSSLQNHSFGPALNATLVVER